MSWRTPNIVALRRRVHEILEQGSFGDATSRAVDRLLVVMIVINLVATSLESVPALGARYRTLFYLFEWASLITFTAEYALRVWAATASGDARARLKYVLSPIGIVDLLAVAPFWIVLFTQADLRFLLVFRMVRFLKLARYSPGMRSLLDALYTERRALFGCFVIITGATLVAASIMHAVEGSAQPEKFGTIPDSMWWAVVTLATVGYGDVTPITPLGKALTAVYILSSLLIIALPIGIVATAFASEIHRRDFVVTWSMVARVPLFAGLSAADIADISRLLRAQTVEAGTMIVRRGESGDSMYFVGNGEVEVELPRERVRLGAGDFFGEVAVLGRTRRMATVTALTRTNLLILDAQDLEALMDREQRIAERIHAAMRGRRTSGQPGDIVASELQGEVEKAERGARAASGKRSGRAAKRLA
ncbi:MAG TPA: cyclic nucleotide-gated ion channel [Xanthobacteraceae bacterium]|jgi:voltage-gated potassium channel